MSQSRRARFFVRKGDCFQVAPELRKMVVFARHNVLKDAPFTKLDLVTCRNLLIYFQTQAQKKVLSLFHFGLKTSGVLFLGPSEGPGDLGDEFETIDARWKIYRKRRDIRLAPDIRLANPIGPERLRDLRRSAVVGANNTDPTLLSVLDTLLDDALPPSLLVNEQREVVRTIAGASRYLNLRDGWMSTDVLEIIDPELRTALAGALPRAFKEMLPVVYKGLRVKLPDGERFVNLTVTPVRGRRAATPFALIRLDEVGKPMLSVQTAQEILRDEASKEQVLSLEGELRSTKDNLQAMIEELETSNEELQATNEELVASNEELQSTNEELHSVNEELYTVNAEFQKKIAELTELSADMDNLLSCTEVHTIFLDSDLRIRKFTPKIAETFNLLPQDVGRRIDSFTHTIKYHRLVEDLRTVASNGAFLERQVRDRRGQWYLMRVLPYRSGTTTEGVVLTLIDIDGIKEAETQAREAVSMRDRFLAMLSHELRNPLAAILNAADVADRQAFGSDGNNWCAVVRRRARHMARLLDDLLDVSRITQNKIEIRTQVVDLTTLVADAVEEVRQWFKEHRLKLTLENSSTPLFVEGDLSRLQQIQVNLLMNAAKYTPEGGKVWYSTKREGNEAVLRVRDTGVGMSSEMLDRAFELFVQADETLNRAGGGIGVGLTLVKGLVQLHGGRVEAHSDGPGKGSEFVVWLPLTEQVPLQPATLAKQTDPTPLRRRVLIVEDDDDIRSSLQELLELVGHTVRVAPESTTALATLAEWNPEIAFVDIGIPGQNGYDLARAIRKNPSNDHLTLVAMTGYGRPSDRQAAMDAGFHGHLTKPVEISAMMKWLALPGGRPNV